MSWLTRTVCILGPLGSLAACGNENESGGAGGDQLCHAGICQQAFTACGGDLTGTWDITALCAEGELRAVIGANGSPACEHMTSYADFAIGGSLTYGADAVERNTTTKLSFTTSYTSACVAARGAGVLDRSVCADIEADLLDQIANARGGCRYDGTNCICSIEGANSVTGRAALELPATADPWISESGWGSYQICVEGDTMTQRSAFLGNLHLLTKLKRR